MEEKIKKGIYWIILVIIFIVVALHIIPNVTVYSCQTNDEIDVMTFNSRFTQYAGYKGRSSVVRSLMDEVRASNAAFPEHEVYLITVDDNGEIIELDANKINNNEMYKIQIEYYDYENYVKIISVLKSDENIDITEEKLKNSTWGKENNINNIIERDIAEKNLNKIAKEEELKKKKEEEQEIRERLKTIVIIIIGIIILLIKKFGKK